MNTNEPSIHTFIIRIWREADDGASIWRGSVECVQSGERVYFQELGHLKELLVRMLNGRDLKNEEGAQDMHPL